MIFALLLFTVSLADAANIQAEPITATRYPGEQITYEVYVEPPTGVVYKSLQFRVNYEGNVLAYASHNNDLGGMAAINTNPESLACGFVNFNTISARTKVLTINFDVLESAPLADHELYINGLLFLDGDGNELGSGDITHPDSILTIEEVPPQPCADDDACEDPALPRCKISTGNCVECLADSDCETSQTCDSNECMVITCTPDCAGKECGSDGCDGICGDCDSGESCDSGLCVEDLIIESTCVGEVDCSKYSIVQCVSYDLRSIGCTETGNLEEPYCAGGPFDCTDIASTEEDCSYYFDYGCSWEEPQSCSDSDGGIDYYKQGTASKDGVVKTDWCRKDSDTLLGEYYCTDEGAIAWDTFDCPAGCADGKCNPTCSDSDGGKDSAVKGTCTDADGEHTDFCIRGAGGSAWHRISEFYCDAGECQAEAIECSVSCYDSFNDIDFGMCPTPCKDITECDYDEVCTIDQECVKVGDTTISGYLTSFLEDFIYPNLNMIAVITKLRGVEAANDDTNCGSSGQDPCTYYAWQFCDYNYLEDSGVCVEA